MSNIIDFSDAKKKKRNGIFSIDSIKSADSKNNLLLEYKKCREILRTEMLSIGRKVENFEKTGLFFSNKKKLKFSDIKNYTDQLALCIQLRDLIKSMDIKVKIKYPNFQL